MPKTFIFYSDSRSCSLHQPLHLFGTRRSEALEQCPQQINALLLENKAQQTLDLAKQTLPEILESAEKNGTTDTLIYYARKIFNACGNNYINTKQYKDGIDYMDSIGNHPLIREHCPHELLSFKAGLNQLYGNNPEAVRLAEDYLQLPVCTSANDLSGRQKS